jgi:prepilin-type N-terminal cleavage/methylation domain-containing protein
MSSRSPQRQNAGMTLIEVMAAMTILAIVASLLYSAFVQTSRNKERIEGQLDRYHEISSGLERMAQEMSMAYTSAHRNPNDALKTMMTGLIAKEQGAGSRIDFTSFSHRRLSRNKLRAKCSLGANKGASMMIPRRAGSRRS